MILPAQEAGLMLSIRHPNCTALLGLCTSPAAIVMGKRWLD